MNNRMKEAKEQIIDTEDKVTEGKQTEQKKKKKKGLRKTRVDLWNSVTPSNNTREHSYSRDPRGRRERKGGRKFEEIIAENFPNLRKETDIQIQDSENPNKVNKGRSTPQHIIIKLAKYGNKGKKKS